MRISPANQYASLYAMNGMRTLPVGILGRSSYAKGVYTGYQKSYTGNVGQAQGRTAGFRKIAEKLQSTDWDKEYRLSGKKSLQNGVRTFVEEYNKMYSQVKSIPANTGGSYGVQLKELAGDNQRQLSAIGIESGKDGMLTINNAKLKKAKASDFKEDFSGSDSLAGKAAVKSIYAEAQAFTLSRMGSYGYTNGGWYGAYGLGSPGLYGYGNSLGMYGLGNSLGMYGSYPYTGRYFDMLL